MLLVSINNRGKLNQRRRLRSSLYPCGSCTTTTSTTIYYPLPNTTQ
jgi:hypothetical protein